MVLPEQFLALFVTRRSLFVSSELLIGGGFARFLNIGPRGGYSPEAKSSSYIMSPRARSLPAGGNGYNARIFIFPKEEAHG